MQTSSPADLSSGQMFRRTSSSEPRYHKYERGFWAPFRAFWIAEYKRLGGVRPSTQCIAEWYESNAASAWPAGSIPTLEECIRHAHTSKPKVVPHGSEARNPGDAKNQSNLHKVTSGGVAKRQHGPASKRPSLGNSQSGHQLQAIHGRPQSDSTHSSAANSILQRSSSDEASLPLGPGTSHVHRRTMEFEASGLDQLAALAAAESGTATADCTQILKHSPSRLTAVPFRTDVHRGSSSSVDSMAAVHGGSIRPFTQLTAAGAAAGRCSASAPIPAFAAAQRSPTLTGSQAATQAQLAQTQAQLQQLQQLQQQLQAQTHIITVPAPAPATGGNAGASALQRLLASADMAARAQAQAQQQQAQAEAQQANAGSLLATMQHLHGRSHDAAAAQTQSQPQSKPKPASAVPLPLQPPASQSSGGARATGTQAVQDSVPSPATQQRQLDQDQRLMQIQMLQQQIQQLSAAALTAGVPAAALASATAAAAASQPASTSTTAAAGVPAAATASPTVTAPASSSLLVIQQAQQQVQQHMPAAGQPRLTMLTPQALQQLQQLSLPNSQMLGLGSSDVNASLLQQLLVQQQLQNQQQQQAAVQQQQLLQQLAAATAVNGQGAGHPQRLQPHGGLLQALPTAAGANGQVYYVIMNN